MPIKHSLKYECIFFTDVDECSLMTHVCEQNCMNTPGSFSCFCNQTYTKTNDGLSCLGKWLNICSCFNVTKVHDLRMPMKECSVFADSKVINFFQ